MKKGIALLIGSISNGGAERVVSVLSRLLAEKYTVYVLVMEDSKDDNLSYECAGKIFNIGGSRNSLGMKIFHTVNELGFFVKKYNIQVVFSFLDVPNLLNILCRHSAKKVISIRCYMAKGIEYNTLVKGIKYQLCKLLYKKADLVIPVSKGIEQQMNKEFHVPSTKLHTIYNPYDIEYIDKEAQKELNTHIKNFISGNNIIVGMGRLYRTKNFDFLLSAFKYVVMKRQDVKLIIIGQGEEKENLKNLAEKLNIADWVLFTGRQKNPFNILKHADIYVGVSSLEGFPNSLVEAMLCNCAVIHTNCQTGPSEILHSYENGQLQKFGFLIDDISNISAENKVQTEMKLAEIILGLLADKKSMEKYSQAARKRAEDFNMNGYLKKYISVIENS